MVLDQLVKGLNDDEIQEKVRTYNKKESARFGLERPVDALFRISLKTAPTPNNAKPRPHIRIAAAQGGYLHRVKVSIGLVAPFAR